jgi:hypothetical protein
VLIYVISSLLSQASFALRNTSNIIRELIPQELGGSVELAFASRGICCKIQVPLDRAAAQAIEPTQ